MDYEHNPTRRRRRRIALSLIVLAGVASATALGIYGLFTATAQNSGNELSSGTVSFTDNDAGAALFNVSDLRPGDSVSRCIKTTYTGSLTAGARLYAAGTPGPLAQYTDLVITQGTQSTTAFPGCVGFAADARGAVFTGTLQSLEQTRTGFANGLVVGPPVTGTWSTNTALVYRVQATLQTNAPDSAQGATSGVHSFVWEARNQ